MVQIHLYYAKKKCLCSDILPSFFNLVFTIKQTFVIFAGRADAELQARRSQELWLACQALNTALMVGHKEASSWEDRLKPLSTEFVAIKKAGDDHPFVGTLIESVPEQALLRGVYTEDALRQRFIRVKRICKKVAMIDDSGGSLLKYLLSYFQSFFIIDAKYELESEDMVDTEQMNTFNILVYAQQFLDAGDVETTIRMLNQLRGEPRRVAADWLQEARLFLEIRQAALLLQAHALDSGVGALHQ